MTTGSTASDSIGDRLRPMKNVTSGLTTMASSEVSASGHVEAGDLAAASGARSRRRRRRRQQRATIPRAIHRLAAASARTPLASASDPT